MTIIIFIIYVSFLFICSILPIFKVSKKYSTLNLVGLLYGLAIGAAATTGVAENAYNNGIYAAWYTIAWGIGLLLFAFFGIKKINKYNISTIPSFIHRIYGEKACILSNVILVILQLILLSSQFMAAGSVMATLLPEIFTFNEGIIISVIIFIMISLLNHGKKIY